MWFILFQGQEQEQHLLVLRIDWLYKKLVLSITHNADNFAKLFKQRIHLYTYVFLALMRGVKLLQCTPLGSTLCYFCLNWLSTFPASVCEFSSSSVQIPKCTVMSDSVHTHIQRPKVKPFQEKNPFCMQIRKWICTKDYKMTVSNTHSNAFNHFFLQSNKGELSIFTINIILALGLLVFFSQKKKKEKIFRINIAQQFSNFFFFLINAPLASW